ncbi:MAG: hypothetical protein ABFD46_03770, partial [Armatimonadota bacterium]
MTIPEARPYIGRNCNVIYRVSGDKVTALQLYKQFSDIALSVDFTLTPETLPEDFRQQTIY